jgi:AraC-like DNA-binding protein
MVAKVPWRPAQGALHAVGHVGVAAIQDLAEEVGQQGHHLGRLALVGQCSREARHGDRLVADRPAGGLARWRTHLALAQLKEDDLPLGELASRHGYQSEAAFSRAFKRVVGVSPGSARQGYANMASTLLPSGSMTKAA